MPFAQEMRAPPAPTAVHDTLRSQGRPLEPAVRRDLEPRFGRDFSGVRVHTDTKAAESARSIGAQAYTMGMQVVFGAARYQPESQGGKRLLAHELAHVVQQGGDAAAPRGGEGAPSAGGAG